MRRLILLLLILLSALRSQATHIFGVDLYYTWVAGNTYTIHLIVYGDCGGVPAFSSLDGASPVINIYKGATSISSISLAEQAPLAGVMVSPVCPADIDSTTCTNLTYTLPGITKFVYTGNVTLTGTSTVWRFLFQGNMGGTTSAGRSNSISNIVSGTIIQLVDTLNNTTFNNSNSVFTSIPTPFYCLDIPANYNPGAVNADGDSLAFFMVPGIDATTGVSVSYLAPYTATAPLGVTPGTFVFNSATGELSFTPNLIQKGLVVYNEEEYRAGVLVGTCQREMSVVVITPCSNIPPNGTISSPSAGTVTTGGNTISVCQNLGAFNYHINPTDPGGNDITMTVSGLPAGATFNIVGNGTLAPLGTFSWNTTGVAPGSYIFYINYLDNGCPLSGTQTIAYTVVVLPLPTETYTPVSAATCTAKSVFHITPGGTFSPATVSVIEGGVSIQTITGVTAAVTDSLEPGTYTIQITNPNNCAVDTIITIASPPLPVPTVVTAPPLCPGGSTASATVTAAGGLAPYQYAIGTGAYGASGTFAGLSPGSYTIYIKDANSCVKDTTVTVPDATPVLMSFIIHKPLCDTYANGFVIVDAYNSISPYTYAIGTGAFTANDTFNALRAGTYTFNVKNANGCEVDTSLTLVDSETIHATLAIVPILCNSGNGTVTVNGTGGFGPPYTYAYNTNPFVATDAFTLATGTYTMRIKDAEACFFDTTVTLTQPTPITITTTNTNVLCNGAATGAIAVTASGGTPGYVYDADGGAYGAASTLSGLSAGTHVVGVKDINGCVYTATVTLTQPSAIVIDSVNRHEPLCNGEPDGALTIYATGGVSSYTYAIGTGTYGASNLFSGIPAGTYTLNVMDANGCIKDTTVTLIQPPGIVPSVVTAPPLCPGGSTGTATITAAGGLTPYQYAIGTGAYTASGAFSGLSPGSYTLYVKDANGCIKDTVVTVPNATPILASFIVHKPLCNSFTNGNVIINAYNSAAPYTYALGTGTFSTDDTFSALGAGSYTFYMKNANGCVVDTTFALVDSENIHATLSVAPILCNSGSGTITINATGGFGPPYTYAYNTNPFVAADAFTLVAGVYTLHVKDPNACFFDTSITLTQPSPITIVTTNTNVLCNGAATGSILVSAGGGTPGYTYSIGSGAFGASSTFSGLTAGLHVIGVKDVNGCIYTDSVTLTQPPVIVIDSVGRHEPSCNAGSDGSMTIYSSGGVSPYTYAIGTGTYGTTSLFSGLTAGSYTLHVKDADGCTDDTSVNLLQPTAIAPSASVKKSICNPLATGKVTLFATGGTPAYTYAVGVGAFTATDTFTALAAGTYTFHIKDANGCAKDTTITIADSLIVSGTVAITPALCYGQASGTLTIIGAGGSSPYTYGIDSTVYGGSDLFTGLFTGSYSLYIKDVNGCKFDTTVSVSQPTVIVPGISITQPSCYGYNDGSVTVTSGGGTPAYTYSYDNSAFTSTTTYMGQVSGIDTVKIKDANGCLHDTVFNVSQPAPILFAGIEYTNISCFNGSDGTVTVNATGAVPPYMYDLNTLPWQVSNVFTGVTAGLQLVKIKDNNGCERDTNITLSQPSQLVFTGLDTLNPTCPGYADGSVKLFATGGTNPYSYSDDTTNFGTANSFPSLTAGTYTFDIKDANGCSIDTTITLTGLPQIIVDSTNIMEPTCYGYKNGALSVIASGGVPPLTYLMIGVGETKSVAIYDSVYAGQYTIAITDSRKCNLDTAILVPQPDSMVITDSVALNDCYGAGDNGAVTAYVAGGTEPYSYLWSVSPANTTPAITGLQNGLYTVWVKDANSCADSSTSAVVFDDCCTPWLPNAFTPGADINNIFRFRFVGDMYIVRFSVYNRFGQEVYSLTNTSDIDQGWNGKYLGVPADLGTYYYYAKIICGNRGDHTKELKGDVTLIR